MAGLPGVRRTFLAVVVSLVLVGTAVGSVWLMASAGVFDAGGGSVPRPAVDSAPSTTLGAGQVTIAGAGIFGQPRDPFQPLVEETTTTTQPGETTTTQPGETTTTQPGETTTTQPGETTTTQPGETTTTQPGETTTTSSSTTTTIGDEPSTTRVALLEIREENGVLIAIVTVDGETFTVGVGDTFAEQFKVISLTATGGVFTYGDSAFSLAVGQAVLK